MNLMSMGFNQLLLSGALLLSCPCFAADDDWAKWRGPADDGVARGAAPTQWSDSTNIAWKLEIQGRGHSSPVIWGNKLFLTTAVPKGEAAAVPVPPQAGPGGPPGGAGGRGPGGPGGGAGAGREHDLVILCIDRISGKVLWQKVVRTIKPHEGYHQRYGSFASNSPVTDGKRLIASFGSYGLFCLDLNGKLIWEKSFDPMYMRNAFGEGAAPTLDGDSLFLKFDHERGSHMLAVDARDGKQIWRADREESSSWSQPYVTTFKGKKQVIVSATNKVRAYEYDSGKLIWECAGLGGNVIPNPVRIGDTVIVMSGFRDPNLLAIKLGGSGDLTGTDSILWTNNRGNSYTASPVLADGKLYFVTDNGMLSCLDAKTGAAHYRQQRLSKAYSFKSSPVAAGGMLYLSTENGDVVVVRMGEKFEEVAINTLTDQMFVATPAVAGGSLYLRGQNTLFCIRDGKVAAR
jgi:outer membrane protein assembly factor BamB